MFRSIFALLLGGVVWILWCFLAITWIVPYITLHFTFYRWFLAYLLCMAPVILWAFLIVLRTRRRV